MVRSLRKLLLQEFENKKSKNPSYSLRALARDIEVSPSVISDYLNEKRKLSPKTKYKIIRYLDLPLHMMFEFRD